MDEEITGNKFDQNLPTNIRQHVANANVESGKKDGNENDFDNSEKLIMSESGDRVGHSAKPDGNFEEETNVSNKNATPEDCTLENEIVENGLFKLPHTAILLETQWGSKVYVVGTAHFSEQSQEDVSKVIRAVQPNFVVLELCESRSYMLKWEENEILKIAEKMEFKLVRETIHTYGLMQGVMYLLLLSVSAQITRELGMAPGGEFRRAYKEATNVPGCVIHLGDRPIEITLRRAFASLSWWQSIKFACYVIFSRKKIDEEDIEKCKNRDYLEEMLAMLGGEFPELKTVFVNERDLFLAHTLINASVQSTGPHGIVPNTVVGVVGMGHLAGIQRNWDKFDPEELRRVLYVPPPSRASKLIKFTLKASVCALMLYGIHKLACRSETYTSLFRK